MRAGPINRQACRCRSCRTRDAAAFERIVSGLTTRREPPESWVFWDETRGVVERINAYTYGKRGARNA